MIIRNDASSLIFFGITAGRLMTEDRSGLSASFFQILSCFSLFTGRKRIYIKLSGVAQMVALYHHQHPLWVNSNVKLVCVGFVIPPSYLYQFVIGF